MTREERLAEQERRVRRAGVLRERMLALGWDAVDLKEEEEEYWVATGRIDSESFAEIGSTPDGALENLYDRALWEAEKGMLP